MNRGKLFLAAMLFLLSSVFFAGQVSAAPGSTCTWTGAVSNLASNMDNWSGCGSLASAVLLFDGNVSNTSTILDVTASVMDFNTANNYAGVISGTSSTDITVSGNMAINTGTIFNQTAGVFTLTGNGATISGSGSVTFYDLIISNTVNFSTNITANTLNNAATINAGSSFITLTGSGDVFLPGTFNSDNSVVVYTGISNVATTTYNILKSEGTQTLVGDVTALTRIFVGSTGTFTQSSGTFTLASSSAEILNLGSLSLYDIAVAGTTTLYGDVTVTDVLNVNDGNTLINGTAGDVITLSGSGTPFFIGGGTFLANTSTVRYTGATVNIATTTYYNLQTTGGGNVFTANGNVTVNGSQFQVSGATFTQSAGTFTMGTGSIIMNNSGSNINFYNLVNNGTGLTGGNVTTTNIFTNNSLFSGGAYSVILPATGTPFVNNGGFIDGNITLSGATVDVPSTTYYNLTLNNATSATLTGSTTVRNVLTVASGRLKGILDDSTLTLSGTGTPLVNNSGLDFVRYDDVGTGFKVKFTGATINISGGRFSNLTVSSTAATLTGNVTTTNLFVLTSGSTLNGGSATFTNTNTGNSSIDLSGTFVAGSSTVVYSGSGAQVGVFPTTYYNLIINGDTDNTLIGTTTVQHVLTINSGITLKGGGKQLTLSATGTPMVVAGTFNAGTSTVIYSGATSNIASTTFYNLTLNGATSANFTGTTTITNLLTLNSGTLTEAGVYAYVVLTATGTPFINNSGASLFNGVAFKYSGSSVNITPATYFDLMIDSVSSTLLGDVLAVDALIINSGKTLNAGANTITLYGVSTAFTVGGTFNVDTSNVRYNNANQSGTSTVLALNYSTLTLVGSQSTYVLAGSATTSVAFANAGTFSLGNYDFVVSSGTYSNSGTTTLSGSGVVKKAATGGFTATSYTSGSGNGTGNTVTITITDPSANLLGAVAESKDVTVVASGYSDSETVTLTETGVATGIFTGTISFNIASGSSSNGKLDVSGSGSITLAYTNGYGALSGAGTSATYSGSTFTVASSGGGGSGSTGTSPVVVLNSGTGVSVAFSNSDPQTVILTFSVTNVSQVAVSEDQNFGSASWETFSSTKQFKLSAGNGAKILYVKFRSASGVETAAYKVIVNVNNGKAASANNEAIVVKTTPAGVIIFNLSNPKSKVMILPVKKLEYKPNTSVAYTYKFKNETNKALKIKVLRQVVDANGKVVSKVNGSTSIAKGKTYKSNVSNLFGSKLANGTYTIVVKIMDSKGNLLAENSFDVMVKKPAPVVKAPAKKK